MSGESYTVTSGGVGLNRAVTTAHKAAEGLCRVIRGKEEFVQQLITCLLAGGHVLIEDVPGLGKTTVAKTLVRLITTGEEERPVTFRRIQFTPDLLPYDITGVDVFDPQTKEFRFSPGPVFANIVLADEINRTTPKVQSALLEAMAEHQVTVGNTTHPLEPLFFVMATQNPIEVEGTYQLPAAQIDRFLMRLSLGYPDLESEYSIVKDDPSRRIMPHLEPVCTKDEILEAQVNVDEVYCTQELMETAVNIAAATREYPGVELGVSPRASIMLVTAARAYALVKGRTYVVDQDIVECAPLVFAHRLILNDTSLQSYTIIREIARENIAKLSQ